MRKHIFKFAAFLLSLSMVLQPMMTVHANAEKTETGIAEDVTEETKETGGITDMVINGSGNSLEASPAMQASSKVNPTQEELIANHYVLYFANCGAQIVDRVAEGDYMGLYQSVTDKEYGPDITGYSWGYTLNVRVCEEGVALTNPF